MNKEEAVVFILSMLRSRMGIMSVTNRQKATSLAQDHQITALDLLQKHLEMVQNI